MATKYSSYLDLGGYDVRLRLQASISTISATQARATWSLHIISGSGGGSASGSDVYSVARSGSSTMNGTRSWNLSGSNDTYLIASGADTISRSYSGGSWTITGSLDDIAYSSSDRSVSLTLSVPRRKYDNPPTPTNLEAVYVNDGRIDLNWDRVSTTSAPVTRAEVRRRSNPDVSWSTIANITAGSLTSYSDRGSRADRHYWYAARVGNADGWSGFAYLSAPPIYTTPSKPGVPGWVKLGSGDVRIYRPSLSPYAARWRIIHIENGVQQSTPLATLPAGTSSWVFPSPDPAATHEFRIIAVSPKSPSGELTSTMGDKSSPVKLQAPPIAPSYAGDDVFDGSESNILQFLHNPTDGSEQRKFQIRHRATSSDIWAYTSEIASENSEWTLPANTYDNGSTFQVEFKTWGAHPTSSDWSETAVITLSARPVVGIDMEPLIESARVTGKITYFDPEDTPMVRGEMKLWRDNVLLETKIVYPGQLLVKSFSARLDNQTDYYMTARVRDGDGIWSTEERHDFFVSYAPPPTPTITTVWDGTSGHVVITVDAPEPSGSELPLESIRVERTADTGWTPVGYDLGPGDTIIDPIPPTGRLVTYRAVSISSLESTAYGIEAVIETRSRWVFINYGPSMHSVVRLEMDPDVSRSYKRNKSVDWYTDRALPLESAGIGLTDKYDLSATLLPPGYPGDLSSGWDDFVSMEDSLKIVCVRDPEGTRMFASVAGFDVTGIGSAIRKVTMSFTRVDYAEEVMD